MFPTLQNFPRILRGLRYCANCDFAKCAQHCTTCDSIMSSPMPFLSIIRTAPVLAALLTICAFAADALPPNQIQTPNGALAGVVSDDHLVRSFKGIPYAAPPVGNLRWKPPQPAPDWTGVRTAGDFGPRCMQGNIFGDMQFRDSGPSEDCLYLNVWTPARPTPARLPVMVWVYGGGFQAGAASEPRQDGANLTKKGVIVVSMNYRLGVFGFLAHPELSRESPHNASGNYGLLDQAAALAWVHENIALFGGDPGNVTIFGESAGSYSISALVASPLSRGLFQKAIGESGALFSDTRPPQTLADAESHGSAFASGIGSNSLEALRALSAADLLQAQSKTPGARFSAITDGYFLPASMYSIYSQGQQAHVPLLAGWNSDESSPQTIFQKDPPTAANYASHVRTLLGEQADAFLKLYPGDTDAAALRAATDYAGDKFIAYSTWKWMELHRATSGAPVFRYEFGQAPPGQTHGAYHSSEIEFVFGALASKNYPWRPLDYRLSNLMSNYWTNFAKTGNPNGPGIPVWPPYTEAARNPVMHLDATPRVAADIHRARYEYLDSLSPYRKAAPAAQ